MKMFSLLALASLFPASAFAHGAPIHQAAEAIEASGKMFAASQPKEVQRLFRSVEAVKVGYEQFLVTLTLSNGQRFEFACRENEDVEPVIWECAAK